MTEKMTFKEKVRGAFEILCVSAINLFGVKLFSRMSIVLGLATWLLYIGKISETAWITVVGFFIGGDFARSKFLKNNGDGSKGVSPIDKIKQVVMGGEEK